MKFLADEGIEGLIVEHFRDDFFLIFSQPKKICSLLDFVDIETCQTRRVSRYQRMASNLRHAGE